VSISLNTKPSNYGYIQQTSSVKNNKKPVFGMKVIKDKNMETVINTLPQPVIARINKLFNRLEKLGKKQVEVEKKRLFGFLPSKKVWVTTEPTCALYADYHPNLNPNATGPLANIEVTGTFLTTDGGFGNSFISLKRLFGKSPAKSIVHLINAAKRKEPLLTKLSQQIKPARQ